MAKALERVAPESRICITHSAAELRAADRIVFPGQGAIGHCRAELAQRDLLGLLPELVREKPVLGVCLGSQLLASVLGAKVYPGKQKEIGWHKIRLTEDGAEDKLWRGVPHEFVGYHWHGDVFDLPAGAEVLASSDLTPIQAYSYGEKAYGFLFHMEVTHTIVENMVRTFEGELKQAGVDGRQILTGADKYLPGLSKIGAGVYSRWATMVA
jgi:GMP synthase (glutamine-hydrolysing)